MSTTNVAASVNEDQCLSDDSESTQGSDLDYELQISVLLPNNTLQKTTIPANMPWSDLRTHLCSIYKLSPSAHVIDYISSTKFSSHKRRSSVAVGRLNISAVIIKDKRHHTKHPAPPPPVPAVNNEGSVRLIVRLPKQRQSILRVNPNTPLSNIITNVANKLQLNEDRRNILEFRHPTHQDMKLNSSLSLNHYNIREVYLAENSAPATPSRTKRKAPPPPRPPPPNIHYQIKVESSDINIKTVNKSPEPVYAQVRKPKPRRKTAPTPQPLSRTKIALAIQDEDDCANSAPGHKMPQPIPRSFARQYNNMNGEEEKLLSKSTSKNIQTSSENTNLDVRLEENVLEDDGNIYSINNDLQTSEIQKKVLKDEISDHTVMDGFKDDDFNVIQCIDNALKSDDGEEILESDSEADGSIVMSADDILEVVNDGSVDSFSLDNEKVTNGDKNAKNFESISPSKIMNHTKNKTFNEELSVDELDVEKKSINDFNDKEIVNDNDSIHSYSDITDDNYTSHITKKCDEDLLASNGHQLLDKNVLVVEVPNVPDQYPTKDEPHVLNESVVPQLDQLNIKEIQTISDVKHSIPNLVCQSDGSSKDPATKEKDDDDFDLHIAESFNIPLRSIDDINSNRDSPEIKRKTEVKKSSKEIKSIPSNSTSQQQHVKSDIEIENERTAKEIEQLKKQVRQMKNRNSTKNKQANLNSWQSGSHSFTFVPSKARQMSHDDYDVAPVAAIPLSNSGEIKGFHHVPEKKTDEDTTDVHFHNAPRSRPALPSYYKKLLGVQAFAATKKSEA